MDEAETTGGPDSNAAYILAFAANALPVLALVIATAVLYRGRDIFLPIAIALILAVILVPIARFLGTWMGQLCSAAFVVLFALGAVAAVSYFLTVELTAVADEVSGYSDNIAKKLGTLETQVSPPWLQHLEYAVSNIQRQVQKGKPTPRPPRVVQAMPAPSSMLENVRPMLPVLDGIVEGLLVGVLLFFLLYRRRYLRDRLVRLLARSGINLTPQVIGAAAEAVGRYLLLFSLTNLGFGLACGLIAWIIGLPSAALWGVMAFLLRFIPYIGAMSSAFLPAITAFALFPGWAKSLEVVASFVLLDQVVAQLVEPFLVGRGIDVSPVALLMSAMYWSWLWGIPGLLLATPVTACLKVAGEYIPALGFFSILLSADRKLDDYHEFYQLLLDENPKGAHELAVHFSDQHGLERTFDRILVPVVRLAATQQNAGRISANTQELLLDTVRKLIIDLGNRCVTYRSADCARVLGFCAPGEAHSLGLLIVIELFRHAGAAGKTAENSESMEEVKALINEFAPDIVCLSCTMTERMPAALKLIKALRRDLPQLVIIAGGQAAARDNSELLKAGCDVICASQEDARRVIRQFSARGAATRPPARSLLEA